MNVVIVVVVAAISVLVPTALVAAFSSTKDTYRYQRHYGPNGYSQEVESDGQYEAQHRRNPSSAPVQNLPVQNLPVENWPEQL